MLDRVQGYCDFHTPPNRIDTCQTFSLAFTLANCDEHKPHPPLTNYNSPFEQGPNECKIVGDTKYITGTLSADIAFDTKTKHCKLTHKKDYYHDVPEAIAACHLAGAKTLDVYNRHVAMHDFLTNQDTTYQLQATNTETQRIGPTDIGFLFENTLFKYTDIAEQKNYFHFIDKSIVTEDNLINPPRYFHIIEPTQKLSNRIAVEVYAKDKNSVLGMLSDLVALKHLLPPYNYVVVKNFEHTWDEIQKYLEFRYHQGVGDTVELQFFTNVGWVKLVRSKFNSAVDEITLTQTEHHTFHRILRVVSEQHEAFREFNAWSRTDEKIEQNAPRHNCLIEDMAGLRQFTLPLREHLVNPPMDLQTSDKIQNYIEGLAVKVCRDFMVDRGVLKSIYFNGKYRVEKCEMPWVLFEMFSHRTHFTRMNSFANTWYAFEFKSALGEMRQRTWSKKELKSELFSRVWPYREELRDDKKNQWGEYYNKGALFGDWDTVKKEVVELLQSYIPEGGVITTTDLFKRMRQEFMSASYEERNNLLDQNQCEFRRGMTYLMTAHLMNTFLDRFDERAGNAVINHIKKENHPLRMELYLIHDD